jgi:DNA-binding NtrC family response regulator
MQVLVLSNDTLIAQFHMTQLSQLAVTVVSVSDVSAALAELETQCPQLIFIALDKPFENTLDFITASSQLFPSVPIVCTYKHHDREVLTQALHCGAKYCLEAPVDTKLFELALRATRILD